MNIKIEIPSANEIKDSKCHLMPCEINFNGAANVSTYFDSIISKTSDGLATASFRGRPIMGSKINLPQDYLGVVIEKEAAGEDPDDTKYKATSRFEQFTYWNLDKNPSQDDKIQQALTWLTISKAIHGEDPS